MGLIKFNQTGKTRTWAIESGVADTIYFCSDGSQVLNGFVYGGIVSVEASTNRTSKIGKVKVNGSDVTVYEHPTKTAVSAAAVKVGYDDMGHVVVGAALTPSDVGAIAATEKGANNGIATLDANGKLTASQIPAGIDEIENIIGCYEYSGNLYRPLTQSGELKPNPALSDFTNDTKINMTGSSGTYYLAINYEASSSNPGIYHYVSGTAWTREYGQVDIIYMENSTGRCYRFAESSYIPVPIIASPGSSDEIIEGTTHKFVTSDQKTKLTNNLDNLIAHLSATNNPHSVTKSQVGLGNVTNNRQIVGLASGYQEGHFLLFGMTGYEVTDAGFGEDHFATATQGLHAESAYAAAITNLRKAADGIRAIASASDTALVSEKNLSTILFNTTDGIITRIAALESALTLEVPES